MLEGKHMTVASTGKQRQTIRSRPPRPATTSTVPDVSSVVDAGAFHAPDGCEAQGCPGFSCAQENESRLVVLGVVAYGI
jgi:hypothetical protein